MLEKRHGDCKIYKTNKLSMYLGKYGKYVQVYNKRKLKFK